MSKKTVSRLLGILCALIALAMYWIGDNNSHLTELKKFFWIPIPFAILFRILAMKTNEQQ